MGTFSGATLVLNGPEGPFRYDISQPRTSLGRGDDNDLVLPDAAVSSRHCEFLVQTNGLAVQDLGSSNGVYVNGRRVQSQVLRDGDVVRIGQYEGRISLGAELLRVTSSIRINRQKRAGPTVVVGAVVVVVAGVAASVVLRVMAARESARDAFAAYESSARAFLEVDPCLPSADVTPRYAAAAHALQEADPAKVDAAALESLKAERLRLAEEARSRTAEEVTRQSGLLLTLKSAGEKASRSVEVATALSGLEALYERRTASARALAKAWESAASETAPNADPVAAHQACRTAHDETREAVLIGLAGVAL